MSRAPKSSRAFTLVEVLVVVLAIAILAAVATPMVGAAQNDARSQSAVNTLLGVRTAIAAHRQRAVIGGNAPFPTLAELTSVGTVTDRAIPANPFTGTAGVRAASLAEATARTVVSPDTYGWGYYVNNGSSPPVAIFFANSSTTTTRTDPADSTLLSANEL